MIRKPEDLLPDRFLEGIFLLRAEESSWLPDCLHADFHHCIERFALLFTVTALLLSSS